jgi:pilus assembly protein Flp/PilA
MRQAQTLLTPAPDDGRQWLARENGMTALLRIGAALAAAEDGATAIEYALLAAMIAMAILVAVTSIGRTVGGVFTKTNDDLTTYMPAP